MLLVRSLGTETDASICRRHHQHGRWQARIGRVSGNKDLYLGTFSTCSSLVVTLLHIPMLPSPYHDRQWGLLLAAGGSRWLAPRGCHGLRTQGVQSQCSEPERGLNDAMPCRALRRPWPPLLPKECLLILCCRPRAFSPRLGSRVRRLAGPSPRVCMRSPRPPFPKAGVERSRGRGRMGLDSSGRARTLSIASLSRFAYFTGRRLLKAHFDGRADACLSVLSYG